MILESLSAVLLLTAGYPMWIAWRANQYTALAHTMIWTGVAWLTWTVSAWVTAFGDANTYVHYLALCLTACAMVAVLGARRPSHGPWNFVVAGLLFVALLPVAQRRLAGGTFTLDTLQTVLLDGIFVVGAINYLLTRLGAAAVLLPIACGLQLFLINDVERWKNAAISFVPMLLVGCVPWLAFWGMCRRTTAASAFDRLWLDFRDRFGLVWSQRLREQFNHSAAHAGWPVVLTWKGLRKKARAGNPELNVQVAMLDTLRALMKRFS